VTSQAESSPLTDGQCERAFDKSPAAKGCTAIDVHVIDGKCHIGAICKDGSGVAKSTGGITVNYDDVQKLRYESGTLKVSILPNLD